MGGGAQTPHLLCTLPFPEPKGTLDKLRKKHPNLKITYMHLTNPNIFYTDYNIPDGKSNPQAPPFVTHPLPSFLTPSQKHGKT